MEHYLEHLGASTSSFSASPEPWNDLSPAGRRCTVAGLSTKHDTQSDTTDGKEREQRTSFSSSPEFRNYRNYRTVAVASINYDTQSDTADGRKRERPDGRMTRRKRYRRHSYDGAETTTIATTADESEDSNGGNAFTATRRKLKRTQSSSSTIAFCAKDLRQVRREPTDEHRFRADRKVSDVLFFGTALARDQLRHFGATVPARDQHRHATRKNPILTSTPNSKAERRRRKRRDFHYAIRSELRQRRIADYCRATTRRQFCRDSGPVKSGKPNEDLEPRRRDRNLFGAENLPLSDQREPDYGGCDRAENKFSKYHSHPHWRPHNRQQQQQQRQEERPHNKTPIKFTTSGQRYDHQSLPFGRPTLYQKTRLTMYKNGWRKNGLTTAEEASLGGAQPSFGGAEACGAPVLLDIFPPAADDAASSSRDFHVHNPVIDFSSDYRSVPSSKGSTALALSQCCSCCRVKSWDYSDGRPKMDYCHELYRGSTATTAGRDSGCMVEPAEYDNLHVGMLNETDASHVSHVSHVRLDVSARSTAQLGSSPNDHEETNFVEISDKIYENLIKEPLSEVGNTVFQSESSASSDSSSRSSVDSTESSRKAAPHQTSHNDEPELYGQLVGAVIRDARKNCWHLSTVDDGAASKAILDAQYGIEKFVHGGAHYDTSGGVGRLLLAGDSRIFERDCEALCISVAEKLRHAKTTSARDYGAQIRRVQALIARLRDAAVPATVRAGGIAGRPIGSLQKFFGKIRRIF